MAGFKNGKIMLPIKEFLIVKGQATYELNTIDMTKVTVFYRKYNQEAFLETYSEMPKGDYRINEVGGNKQLEITNLDILDEYYSIQLARVVDLTSSPYSSSGQVDPITLNQHLNEVIADVTFLFTYLKDVGMVMDSSSGNKIMAELKPYTTWYMDKDGNMAAMPVDSLFEKFNDLVEELRKEVLKLLEQDLEVAERELLEEVKRQLDEYVETDLKQRLDDYTTQLEGRLQTMIDQAVADKGLMPEGSDWLEIGLGNWLVVDLFNKNYIHYPPQLNSSDNAGVVKKDITDGGKSQVIRFYTTTGKMLFIVRVNEVWSEWQELGEQTDVMQFTQPNHEFVFTAVTLDGATRQWVKANKYTSADGIAIKIDNDRFDVVTRGVVNIPTSARDDKGEPFVYDEYYFLSQEVDGGFSRTKNEIGTFQYLAHISEIDGKQVAYIDIGDSYDLDYEVVDTETADRVGIGTYKTTLRTADTIEDLKRLNLKEGDVVEVLGYYTKGDGAGGNYIIGDNGNILLDNGLFAEKVDIGNERYIYNELFKYGDKTVPNFTIRRIPSICTTNNGSILATCDLRGGNGGDLPNKIKVGLRKSINQGISWTPIKVIMSLGDLETQGIGDSCLVHNYDSGRTFCFALHTQDGSILNPDTNIWNFYMTYSDDDGENWSELKDISSILPSGYKIIFNGIGNGVYHNGIVYVPIQVWQNLSNGDSRECHSGVMYSNDNGESWQVTKLVSYKTSECSCTVYNDKLYLACKDESFTVGRMLFKMNISNLNSEWTEVIQDTYSAGTEGSLITIKGDDISILVKSCCSGLGTSTPRDDMSIRISKDGQLWEKVYQLKDSNGLGYSSMAYDKDYLYVLYESNYTRGVFFKRFPIDEIKNKTTDLVTYTNKLLNNPKMIGDTIYLEENTEILYLTTANKDWLKKIKNAKIGKRLIITTNLEEIHFGIQTSDGSEEYQIIDDYLPVNSQFKLFNNDILELILLPDKKWKIVSFTQRRPRIINASAIKNGELNLNGYLGNEIILKGNGTPFKITSIINVANRDKIYVRCINSDFIIETTNYRYLIPINTSFNIVSQPVSSSYALEVPLNNIPLKINSNNIDSFLEPNLEQKSLKLFDNITDMVFDLESSGTVMSNEFEFIRITRNINFIFIRDITGGGLVKSSSSLAGFRTITNTEKIDFSIFSKINLTPISSTYISCYILQYAQPQKIDTTTI